MKKIALIIVLVMLANSGMVSSALPPAFLGATDSRISPAESARIGDLITAGITLKKITPAVPKSANMSLHTDVVNPIFRVVIDGTEYFKAASDMEIELSVDTVKNISIEVNGRAPSVESLTQAKALEVKMYSFYNEEDQGTQTLASLLLRISTQEITETVRSINEAKRLFDQVEAVINDLDAQGKDVVNLRNRLVDVQNSIKIADENEARGATTNAKTLADQSIRELSRIKADAEGIRTVPPPTEIKRYLTIGGAVVVALLIILFIKGRREELG